MLLKRHEGNRKLVLAICDDDIIGKTYKEGETILDLTSDFYKGEQASEEDIIHLLKKAHVVNAAGNTAAAFLVEQGIIGKEDIHTISGIPAVQVILKW